MKRPNQVDLGALAFFSGVLAERFPGSDCRVFSMGYGSQVHLGALSGLVY